MDIKKLKLRKNKVNTITLHKYAPHKMAYVKVNTQQVYMGNYWDFHPGCHGENDLGDFNGPNSYCISLSNFLNNLGYKTKIKVLDRKTPINC